jgi:hypothetical protein
MGIIPIFEIRTKADYCELNVLLNSQLSPAMAWHTVLDNIIFLYDGRS